MKRIEEAECIALMAVNSLDAIRFLDTKMVSATLSELKTVEDRLSELERLTNKEFPAASEHLETAKRRAKTTDLGGMASSLSLMFWRISKDAGPNPERRFGNPLSEEERAQRHTERYGSGSPLPPRGTGRSNPSHHSRNLKQSVAIGAGTGGIVYGLAKWKEDEVRRRLRISPELLGVISGAAGCGASYYLI